MTLKALALTSDIVSAAFPVFAEQTEWTLDPKQPDIGGNQTIVQQDVTI